MEENYPNIAHYLVRNMDLENTINYISTGINEITLERNKKYILHKSDDKVNYLTIEDRLQHIKNILHLKKLKNLHPKTN